MEDRGKKRRPNAPRLMISADGGGGNGHRVRLWKIELQNLADALKLPITACRKIIGRRAEFKPEIPPE